MKKKRLKIVGLIAAIALILFIGFKFVRGKEQIDPKDYYQIVDKDFDSIVDVTGRSYILLKNLQTNETESIYELNTLSYRNMDLSATDGKLLFTDEKFNVGYVYLYDVKSKELKEMKTPYEQIGSA